MSCIRIVKNLFVPDILSTEPRSAVPNYISAHREAVQRYRDYGPLFDPEDIAPLGDSDLFSYFTGYTEPISHPDRKEFQKVMENQPEYFVDLLRMEIIDPIFIWEPFENLESSIRENWLSMRENYPKVMSQIFNILGDKSLTNRKVEEILCPLILENIDVLSCWEFKCHLKFNNKKSKMKIDDLRRDYIHEWITNGNNLLLNMITLRAIAKADLQIPKDVLCTIFIFPWGWRWEKYGRPKDSGFEISDDQIVIAQSGEISLKSITQIVEEIDWIGWYPIRWEPDDLFCRLSFWQTKLWSNFEKEFYGERFSKAPSFVLKLTPGFTGQKPIEQLNNSSGDKMVKTYFWIDNKKQTKKGVKKILVASQLELMSAQLREDYDNDLDKFLRRNFGALGLKVNYGIIALCSDNFDQGNFIYNPNDYLDLLGYARTIGNKYHQANNKYRIEELINIYANNVKYIIEIGDENEEMLRMRSSLISINSGDVFERIRKKQVIWSGCRVIYCPELWKQITQKNPKYFLFDKQFLKLDADIRKLSIYIYPVVCWLWSLNGKSVTRSLEYITKEIGLSDRFVDTRHRAREIKEFYDELNKLCIDGLLGNWEKHENIYRPYNLKEIKITFTMPERHGLPILSNRWAKKYLKE